MKIGKDPARCQIVIDRGYKKVSRVHCGVLRKGKSFYVRDYSTNGTFRSAGDQRMQSGGAWNTLCADQILIWPKRIIGFIVKFKVKRKDEIKW